MRWGAFALLLLAVAVIQTAVLGAFRASVLENIDLFLVLALLYGLCAPPRPAPVAAWIVGIAQDLFSIDALGVHALSLALAVAMLVRLREWTFSEVWWVQIALGFLTAAVAGLLAALLSALNLRLWGGAAPSLTAAVGPTLLRAIVASVLAAMLIAAPSLVARRGLADRIGRARR